jgi:uncharacterized membrane protein YedE/YeeE
MSIRELLLEPWPWYVTGPMIGLLVPMLLLIGNRAFGVSSTFRHLCAICAPARIPYFHYEWRRDIWNLVFVAGIALGGFIAMFGMTAPETQSMVTPEFASQLAGYGIEPGQYLLPRELFDWERQTSAWPLMLLLAGGYLIGFGTRYAGGCTGGHVITGIATLQRASMIAAVAFMVGGFIMANLLLPWLLRVMH